MFQLNYLGPEVRWTLGAVVLLLGLVSLLLQGCQWLYPQRRLLLWRIRLRSWWYLAGLFGFVLLLSPQAAIVLLGFASFLALKEYLSYSPTRRADRRVLFWAYVAVPLQYYFAAMHWYGMFLVFLPVFVFTWLPTRMLLVGDSVGYLRAAGTLHWGMMIAVFSLSHAAFLLVLPVGAEPRWQAAYPSLTAAEHPGPGLVLMLVLATVANDGLQAFWSRMLGGRPIAPLIRDDRTWRGAVGAIGGTTLFSVLLGPQLTLLDELTSAVAGVLIAVAGLAGSLNMAALKRDLQIRDFGSMLLGHGGVLDRIDSLTFTAPLFFHFVYYGYV